MEGSKLPVIGSILRYFPTWSETFVYRELMALRQQGLPIEVICMRHRGIPELVSQSVLGHSAGRPTCVELPRFPAYIPMLPGALRMLMREGARAVEAWRWGWQHLKWREGLKALWMADYYLQKNVSLLHVHFSSEAAEVAEIIRIASGIPYIITVHARDIFVPRPSLPDLLKSATEIICISEFNQRFLLQHYPELFPTGTRRLSVIRLGVPAHLFEASPTPNNGQFRLLSVARLVEKKGLKFLIQSVKRLRERGIPVRLTVVGEGILRKPLERLIEELQLKDVVQLLGKQTQKEIELLYQSGVSAFVLPAVRASDGDMDGIPVALMEAMARSVPVVSCPVSGIPELIPGEAQGLLVPPEDVSALTEALERLYRDPLLRQQLASNGRSWVAEHFSLDKNAREVAALLERVAARGFPENSLPESTPPVL